MLFWGQRDFILCQYFTYNKLIKAQLCMAEHIYPHSLTHFTDAAHLLTV